MGFCLVFFFPFNFKTFFFFKHVFLQDKWLKEKLLSLVDSGLFDHIPEPEKDAKKNDKEQTPDASSTSGTLPGETPVEHVGSVAYRHVDVTFCMIRCFPLQWGSV